MSITRLTGGLTPGDGGDPRTFPAIFNATADTIEAQGSAITAVEGSAVALGSAIDVIEAWNLDDLNDVTIAAVADAQVLAYSTAVSGWVNADAASGGKILQVVSVTKTNAFSTNSSTYVDVTDLSVSITPSSLSSKILVLSSVILGAPAADRVDFQLVRNSTAIAVGDSSGVTGLQATLSATVTPGVGLILDAPNTTSAVTYKAQIKTGGSTGYVNRRSDSATPLTFSSITVMEVAG